MVAPDITMHFFLLHEEHYLFLINAHSHTTVVTSVTVYVRQQVPITECRFTLLFVGYCKGKPNYKSSTC